MGKVEQCWNHSFDSRHCGPALWPTQQTYAPFVGKYFEGIQGPTLLCTNESNELSPLT